MHRFFNISSVVVFIASLTINAYFFNSYVRTLELVKNQRAYQTALKKYPLLAPHTLQGKHGDFLLNFLDLRSKLHQMIDPLGDKVELYFEYLPTGTSIGINSGNNFFAASLFKLPVVMAYYRHKESLPSTKRYKVVFSKEMLDDRFGDLWKKGEGYELDLDDAARLALQKSDNTAAKALGTVITQDDFDTVYLGVDVDLQIASEGAVMTAKKYSAILKALYYSQCLQENIHKRFLITLHRQNLVISLLPAFRKELL
jgi:beta-lactamase class A